MAIINVEWCDFVVFSGGKIFVDWIWFDLDYWSELLLPKLQTFYVHVAREILSADIFWSVIISDCTLISCTPHL